MKVYIISSPFVVLNAYSHETCACAFCDVPQDTFDRWREAMDTFMHVQVEMSEYSDKAGEE